MSGGVLLGRAHVPENRAALHRLGDECRVDYGAAESGLGDAGDKSKEDREKNRP
jgi:hypothetical protein